MNSLLLPSRNPPTPEQLEKFAALTMRVRARMLPGTPEEAALCDQVIIALWHFRTFRAKGAWNERLIHKLEKNEPNSLELPALREACASAQWQAKRQKNFAWRRRGEFFAIKTAREESEKLQFTDQIAA